jgi:hypothetical protein
VSRWPGALLALLALAAAETPVAADVAGADAGGDDAAAGGDDAGAGDASEPEVAEAMHWAVGVGGFVGLTGPGRYGLAAEAEVFPRWPGQLLDDHVGLGLRYRGFDGLARGIVAGGPVYAAAATRPHLAIELHGDIGMAFGPADGNRLLLGGGVRTQIGLWGPVAVALHGDVYYTFEGLRLRPHIVPAVTVGLTR